MTKVTPNKARTYPYLGHYTRDKSDFVVLFRRKHTGTVVYKGLSDKYGVVGDYMEDWVEIDFAVFHGSITISTGK